MSTTISQAIALDESFIFPTYARAPVVFVRGDGVTLYDESGKSYLDFLGGIAVNALGYNHPRVVAAMAEQASKILHVSNLFHNEYQSRLAEKLCALSGLHRVFFCNSGTEANEAAIKLARNRAYRSGGGERHDKFEIVALVDSFHGRTVGALSITGQPKFQLPFAPLMPGARFVPANDIAALTQAVNEHTCAVILEPIQGESGIQVLTPEFLHAARAACDRVQALLIFDEVQCGLGRTGHYFAFQNVDVRPDVVTLAKPLGLGVHMGAMLGGENLKEDFAAGTHGSTFGGGPLASRLSLEFFSVLEDEHLLQRIAKTGAYFTARLKALKDRFALVKDVRGAGLMIGMELDSSGKGIVRSMLERGFVINCAHETVLRFLPPYLIAEEHIDRMTAALGEIFTRV